MKVLQKHASKNYRLGRSIQRVRKAKGFTQEQLAEKLRISLTYMGNMEIGRKVPNMRMLYRIAEALEVKVKELIPF